MLGLLYTFDNGNNEKRAILNTGLFGEFMAQNDSLFR